MTFMINTEYERRFVSHHHRENTYPISDLRFFEFYIFLFR